jgi:hypothetical protein
MVSVLDNVVENRRMYAHGDGFGIKLALLGPGQLSVRERRRCAGIVQGYEVHAAAVGPRARFRVVQHRWSSLSNAHRSGILQCLSDVNSIWGAEESWVAES